MLYTKQYNYHWSLKGKIMHPIKYIKGYIHMYFLDKQMRKGVRGLNKDYYEFEEMNK